MRGSLSRRASGNSLPDAEAVCRFDRPRVLESAECVLRGPPSRVWPSRIPARERVEERRAARSRARNRTGRAVSPGRARGEAPGGRVGVVSPGAEPDRRGAVRLQAHQAPGEESRTPAGLVPRAAALHRVARVPRAADGCAVGRTAGRTRIPRASERQRPAKPCWAIFDHFFQVVSGWRSRGRWRSTARRARPFRSGVLPFGAIRRRRRRGGQGRDRVRRRPASRRLSRDPTALARLPSRVPCGPR